MDALVQCLARRAASGKPLRTLVITASRNVEADDVELLRGSLADVIWDGDR